MSQKTVPQPTEFAEARLALISLEYSLFRVTPQITLEILMIAMRGGGSCDLSHIYKEVRATHPAIRQHVNSMQKQELLIFRTSPLDRRARILYLSPKARYIIADYLKATKKIMTVKNSMLDELCEGRQSMSVE